MDDNFEFEKPEGNKDQVTITNTIRDDEGEVVGGEWESDTPVSSVIVKGGPDAKVVSVEDPKTSGSFDNSGLPGAISNVQFCTTDCDAATLLDEDTIDPDSRTLSNTIVDDDGVFEFTFTTLDNFTVQSINPSSGFDRSDNTWTWTGSGDPPPEVDFTLKAGDGNTSTYFLEVLNDCGTTVTFDPAYEFGPAASRTQLAGNAPNPFSGQTTIKFDLAEQSRVTVAVYDMMGRKVATLVDGVRSSGPHTVGWNGQSDSGQDLASGVYLLRMRAEGKSETRRMTIVR